MEVYKIYNDGGHFVAVKPSHTNFKRGKKKQITEMDKIFDMLYHIGVQNNYSKSAMFDYILTEFTTNYCLEDNERLREYITNKITAKLHNLHKRKQRFKRKANLNKWNYFVTFTYDDKLHTADSFKRKIRKCLSNLHTRRGWKYMGVFELAPQTKRLHFHGLFYIPADEMIGEIEELKDYSFDHHKMKTSHQNTFFTENFGRNDFAEINATEMTINYILKYIHKTNEKIVYSRGIASEIFKEINDSDIATEFEDFVLKYVLFDDVIDFEKDIYSNNIQLYKDKPKIYKQMTFA